MKEYSRFLRKNQTEVEAKFWNIVGHRKFYGFRFQRQYVLHGYIVDFVCFQKLLIIEFDGLQHLHLENKEYDKIRDNFLSAGGFTVLRFMNQEFIQKTDYVLCKIYNKLIELPDTPRYLNKNKILRYAQNDNITL